MTKHIISGKSRRLRLFLSSTVISTGRRKRTAYTGIGLTTQRQFKQAAQLGKRKAKLGEKQRRARQKRFAREGNLLLTDVVVRSSNDIPNGLRYLLNRGNNERKLILKPIENLEKSENGSSGVYLLEKNIDDDLVGS